jgi:dTMP kinase
MSNQLVITVEGIDGCGKGTNTKKMVEYLESRGKSVKLYSFPRYESTIGKVIARYLKGEFGPIDKVPYELICTAYAADRASIQNDIKNSFECNGIDIVIMDRYTYSNLFTAAKLPEEQWKSFIDWIEDLEFNNLGIRKPDYNFYLYIDPMVSIQRINERGKREYQEGKEDIHENNSQLLINTAKCYLQFAKSKDNWFVIDQMKDGNQLSTDEVFELIKEKLDIILEK